MAFEVKTSRVLLTSAARTADTTSDKQHDIAARSLRLYLKVTVAVAGTGGLQPVIRGYDKVSGTAIELSAGGAAVTAVGLYCYEMAVSVGAASGNVKEAVARHVPLDWDVIVKHGDGSSYTYSLSAELI